MAHRYRVAIVGAGPAGLSAAAHAAKIGVDHILIDRAPQIADTIFHYQRGKHIMDTPARLRLRSDLDFSATSREALLELWDEQTSALNVQVRLGAELKSVTGARGDFTLHLADGDTVLAEAVVLAIGTQGNPNLLRCEGGDLPFVQYQLDDPEAYIDEHILVVGGGDAGIENALGLAADAAQGNRVTLSNRSAELSKAKDANVQALLAARDEGRVSVVMPAVPARVEKGWVTLSTAEGDLRLPCDRVIARLGSSPPRAFVKSLGLGFTSEAKDSFPALTSQFESTVPGIYVIGALAGYPLIKHCMNQGLDVVEYLMGNSLWKPADEAMLAEKLQSLPGDYSVSDWLEFLRDSVAILNPLSTLQMREFLLDSEVRAYRPGEVVFRRNDVGSSLFGIASGKVLIEVDLRDPNVTAPIGAGSIFGEVGLISGRPRGATVRAAEDCILIEVPRNAALKLISSVEEIRQIVERTTTERELLQIFSSGLTRDDIAELLSRAEVLEVAPDEAVVREGETSRDMYVVLSGSMVVEREIARRPVFLSYIPAGSYFGEMALFERSPRTATVRAAIRSKVIRLDGQAFDLLLNRKPELVAKLREDMASRRELNAYIEQKKESFSDVVEMYSSVSRFLVEQGLGEATDVLLIDESLCIGCDNCEKACADAHDGLSRLNREAGRTYDDLHVPTSCRHCEHPYCMTDCPPNAIRRGPDGEVFIDDTCIGCGNCQRACPYGVIRMDAPPPRKPPLWSWLLFGRGPGPGEPDSGWKKRAYAKGEAPHNKAIKCDMCAGKAGGPACVRACPTGAAVRASPEDFLSVTLMNRDRG